jgi:hypothetical protein
MRTFILSTILLGSSFCVQAQEIIVNPDAGGLQKTFTQVKGKAIAHPADFPQDGKGTVLYLKDVCRAFQHDELVKFEIQKASSFDSESQQWIDVDVTPRIYKSVTCAVYLK